MGKTITQNGKKKNNPKQLKSSFSQSPSVPAIGKMVLCPKPFPSRCPSVTWGRESRENKPCFSCESVWRTPASTLLALRPSSTSHVLCCLIWKQLMVPASFHGSFKIEVPPLSAPLQGRIPAVIKREVKSFLSAEPNAAALYSGHPATVYGCLLIVGVFIRQIHIRRPFLPLVLQTRLCVRKGSLQV